MKTTFIALAVLLGAGLASAGAVPNPGGSSPPPAYTCACPAPVSPPPPSRPPPKPKAPPGKPPPPPPPATGQQVSQTCSASSSSVNCCNQGGPNSYTVSDSSYSYAMQCSQIDANSNNPVQSICETTVACCIGTGCTAIAE